MKLKNTLNLAAICTVWLALAVVALGQAAAKTPKIAIPKTDMNFGDIKKGSTANFTFVFKNEGSADLEIKRVAPSWGCAASDFTKVVPPGQEGKITLSVGTDAYTGAVTKSAEVYTNDPQKEQFTLTVSMVVLSDMTPQGKIVGPFIVGPNNQMNMRSPRGLSSNALVTITNNTAEPIKISQMNPGGEAFSVKMQTLEEGKRYALEILSSPNLPSGNHSQTVKLTTDSKQMPELTIDLQVVVAPAVTVNPATLVFENVPVSDPESDVTYLSKFVWVKLARGNGLEVKSITSDLPFLKIKNESNDPNGQTILLRVGFGEKPLKGTHIGKIKIETNNSDVKEVEVPVKIIAK